eukprot:765011-Hanusia_phi.AAC.2
MKTVTTESRYGMYRRQERSCRGLYRRIRLEQDRPCGGAELSDHWRDQGLHDRVEHPRKEVTKKNDSKSSGCCEEKIELLLSHHSNLSVLLSLLRQFESFRTSHPSLMDYSLLANQGQ